ncbi:ABC transporter ATP-binding protein [Pseudoxanthomonas taiwanensis]|uniref:ABC transporter ATP-binding protein n=1 Tax=Pseudoxanthomonas taiwanensis TaxID=176598 RepID=A0A921P525_9GAMM|nr:ABC transporter ATP-binding protein [Pseudoxanthomonas taiwanensis]KAF1689905.1 ABC transporter ATP-binding protein [Pseudoxanthomonas taiwanensis]
MSSERQQPALGEPVIRVDGVGKTYRMYEKPSQRLWQALTGRDGKHREFHALRDVSFQVRRGETVGIIGRNGSGKSTLLQIIAGTLRPTTGTCQVHGRVAALLELGSGFNPDFTGRENVYLNGTILGLTRAQIDERMQQILDFADIGEFIDQPVRSYSSGMAVRLAFAVIAHVDADILIVDEALSVGDAFFAQKCMRFLRNFQKHGTLLFVSHDAAAVTNLCSRAIWLEDGQVRMEGRAGAIVEAYMAQQHARGRADAVGEVVHVDVGVERRRQREEACREDFRKKLMDELGVCNRLAVFEFDPDRAGPQFGAGGATIVDVALLDAEGQPAPLLSGGEVVNLRISVRANKALESTIVGFYVKDRLGQRLFGDNTYLAYRNADTSMAAGEVIDATFRFRMPVLPSGSYMVDAAVASGSQDDHTQQHWLHDALEFRAVDETMRHGLVGIPMAAIEIARRQGE